MGPVLRPFDTAPLIRLVEKMASDVASTRKYDRVTAQKDQPLYSLNDFIKNATTKKAFTIESGLTFRTCSLKAETRKHIFIFSKKFYL